MSSQHADPALTVRLTGALKAQAQTVLDERHREMRGFVVACFTALTAAPDEFLAQLDPHWPDRKPRGRPRQSHTLKPLQQGHDHNGPDDGG